MRDQHLTIDDMALFTRFFRPPAVFSTSTILDGGASGISMQTGTDNAAAR